MPMMYLRVKTRSPMFLPELLSFRLEAMRVGQLALGEAGLMFVPTGATHTFGSKGMIKELGLKIGINVNKIKTFNY